MKHKKELRRYIPFYESWICEACDREVKDRVGAEITQIWEDKREEKFLVCQRCCIALRYSHKTVQEYKIERGV